MAAAHHSGADNDLEVFMAKRDPEREMLELKKQLDRMQERRRKKEQHGDERRATGGADVPNPPAQRHD